MLLPDWLAEEVRNMKDEDFWHIGMTTKLVSGSIYKLSRNRKWKAQTGNKPVNPHMLRHFFVDQWLRAGGSETDLARLAGWSSTAMAGRYAQHRAAERALTAHKTIAPLDRL